jgi:MFS family permease
MLALAATLAIQALVSMAVLTPPVFAPLAAPAIGVAASETGIFMAFAYGGASVASMASGALLRRFGAMRLSQLCLVFCSIGVALVATAALPVVVLGAIILGLGYGPVTPASSHILVRQAPPARRAFIFSAKQTGVPLGGVLAGGLVPPLVVAFGWQIAAIAVGLCGCVLALAVEPLRPRFDAEEPKLGAGERRGIFEGIRLVLSLASLRLLSLASFTFGATQLSFATFIVAFLTDALGFDLVSAGSLLAVGQTAGIVARLVWGWVADRFIAPWRLLSLLGFVMAGATVAVGLFTPTWPYAALVLVALVHGATAIGWNGIYLSEVARLAPPGTAGAATGGALAITFLGIVTGPPLFSLIVAMSGSYRPAFFATAALALLGGLACLVAGKRR